MFSSAAPSLLACMCVCVEGRGECMDDGVGV